MEETRICVNIRHNVLSIHLKESVPIELFNKPNSIDLFKYCSDCRDYDKIRKHNRTNQHKEKYTLSIQNGNDLMYCPGKSHLTVSKYKRDKVPEILFRQFKDYDNSPFFINCREIENNKNKIRREIKSNNDIDDNLIRCQACRQKVEEAELAYNLNGELSACCVPCKIKQHDVEMWHQSLSQSIKFEMIEKYESCCYVCQNIFIKDPSNNKIIFEIETYLIDGIRYLDYEGILYKCSDFIIAHKNNIMLQVLQFDHLTEDEQRTRGMLREDQPFIPKNFCVLNASNEFLMRAEAAKCQLCCMKCHLLETIRREKGLGSISKLSRVKLDYINKLKEEGCVLCGYKNNELPRYFHFDHIDVETKVERVSKMMHVKYSFQDVVDEIKKCRILCQPCHFIRTQDQLKEGMFHRKNNDTNN